jgi:hypothetical protein
LWVWLVFGFKPQSHQKKKTVKISQVWWAMSVILATQEAEQEDQEFEACLGNGSDKTMSQNKIKTKGLGCGTNGRARAWHV